MARWKGRSQERRRRHLRARKKLFGTADRPRLCVRRSLKHIYAQLIDDRDARTLLSLNTLQKEVRDGVEATGNVVAARRLGELLARKALESGINEAVFDRAGYKYHGRVQAVADGAREGGLKL